MKTLELYTDGAVRKNGEAGAVGGWGVYGYYRNGDEQPVYIVLSGAVEDTTNQRMELTAGLEALIVATDYQDRYEDIIINIYTDSAYFYNCWDAKWYKKWEENGWITTKKQPVTNKDLWEKIIPYFKKKFIKLIKVKGHSGNKGNTKADKLAVTAMDDYRRRMNENSCD